MRAFADQIRPFVPGRYAVLGTDGFGRSDYRVDAAAVLRGRPPPRRGGGARRRSPTTGAVEAAVVQAAIERYGIDADAAAPWTR